MRKVFRKNQSSVESVDCARHMQHSVTNTFARYKKEFESSDSRVISPTKMAVFFFFLGNFVFPSWTIWIMFICGVVILAHLLWSFLTYNLCPLPVHIFIHSATVLLIFFLLSLQIYIRYREPLLNMYFSFNTGKAGIRVLGKSSPMWWVSTFYELILNSLFHYILWTLK